MKQQWPKLIILPLVDLTIGSHSAIGDIFQGVFKEHHFKADNWALDELIGKPIDQLVEIIALRMLTEPTAEIKTIIARQISDQTQLHFDKLPKPSLNGAFIKFAIAAKQRNSNIACLSWLEPKTSRGIIDNHDSQKLIHTTLSTLEVPRSSPFPDGIFKIMNLTQVTNPEDVAFVGTTKSDLLAGYHAGCKWNVLITKDSKNPKWNAYPCTHIFETLDQLIDAFNHTPQKKDMQKILGRKNSIQKRLR
jgi:phosphoglycolate phosphatase-like HAD superfamily hydrolase